MAGMAPISRQTSGRGMPRYPLQPWTWLGGEAEDASLLPSDALQEARRRGGTWLTTLFRGTGAGRAAACISASSSRASTSSLAAYISWEAPMQFIQSKCGVLRLMTASEGYASFTSLMP